MTFKESIINIIIYTMALFIIVFFGFVIFVSILEVNDKIEAKKNIGQKVVFEKDTLTVLSVIDDENSVLSNGLTINNELVKKLIIKK